MGGELDGAGFNQEGHRGSGTRPATVDVTDVLAPTLPPNTPACRCALRRQVPIEFGDVLLTNSLRMKLQSKVGPPQRFVVPCAMLTALAM